MTNGESAIEGRKEGIGVMEVDARDGLGGRGGGLPEAAAQGADEGEIQRLMTML